MTTVLLIDGNLQWTAIKSNVCDRWILTCEPLGLVLEANSPDEFSGLIEESLNILFTDLHEDEEFDAFLHERGWRSVYRNDADEIPRFDVPWTLVKQTSMDGQERTAH